MTADVNQCISVHGRRLTMFGNTSVRGNAIWEEEDPEDGLMTSKNGQDWHTGRWRMEHGTEKDTEDSLWVQKHFWLIEKNGPNQTNFCSYSGPQSLFVTQ